MHRRKEAERIKTAFMEIIEDSMGGGGGGGQG